MKLKSELTNEQIKQQTLNHQIKYGHINYCERCKKAYSIDCEDGCPWCGGAADKVNKSHIKYCGSSSVMSCRKKRTAKR